MYLINKLSLGVILNLLVEGDTILFLLEKLKVDFFLDLLLLLLEQDDDPHLIALSYKHFIIHFSLIKFITLYLLSYL